jgi:hypothetical protein
MPTRPPRAGATPRRAFLKLAALAPAAAAGCVTLRPAQGPAAAPAPAPGPSDPLAALRAFPLAPGAEPAFVFRARGTGRRGP